MKHSVIRANILYGLVTIVPLAIIGLILVELLKNVRILAAFLDLDYMFGAGAAMVSAFVLLVAICYGTGAFVRTRIGSWTFGRVEQKFLQHVPGYGITSNTLNDHADHDLAYQPVLAQLSAPGAAIMGLFVEEKDSAPYCESSVKTAQIYNLVVETIATRSQT
ncbi:MAG: hypothetical protein P8Y12_05470 [Gammaproteobacteria bacterium]